MFKRFFRAATFSTLVALAVPAQGAVIYQSAQLGSPVYGFSVAFDQFLGSRFSLTQSYLVTSVGGIGKLNPACIGQNTCPDWNGLFFAAIIKLDSATSLPSFPVNALDTNALAFGTFTMPPEPGALFSVPMDVFLGPGSYALLFGSGVFGTWGVGYMPQVGPDFPDASYFYSDTTKWIDGSFSSLFIVEGTLVTPLPTTLPLFATGLGALGLLGWRRKRQL